MDATKKVIAQLWEWIESSYSDSFPGEPEQIDRINFGYQLTYGDVRRAAEELGIISTITLSKGLNP